MNTSATPLRWLALLRIMMGVIFLTTWVSNLQKGFYTPDGLQHFFTQVYPQSHNPIAPYAAFIQNVLLPARAVFAPFQLVAELSLGVLLLLGAFTPVVGVGGAFFLFNIFLATYGTEWPWTYLSLIGVCIAVAASRSGRVFGLDAILARRLPASLPVT
jgi:uncharacterized membrane protein YphA (DoxX/SURF4 family)